VATTIIWAHCPRCDVWFEWRTAADAAACPHCRKTADHTAGPFR
jgi:primosomal protein N'